MKLLLLGGGAREHAMGWKLARSPLVDTLISVPGNPGLSELGPVVDGIAPTEAGAVAALAEHHGIDLVVVGPEAPLAAGVVDTLTHHSVRVFGPGKTAARLESSKSFAKAVMQRAGVPTGAARAFTERTAAHDHLRASPGPFVVKADGLAAGKGVLVTSDLAAAKEWVDRCLAGEFGEAGRTVLIEEHLAGPEVSVFALCDGEDAVPLQPARDYKRLANGDRGPNTGGMGCYSPVDDLPPDLVDWTMEHVVGPVLGAMSSAGDPYRGFLYAGLVLTEEGPQVLEFNCRLGDPETQVVLPRLEDDLAEIILTCLDGGAGGLSLSWSSKSAVDVVLAAAGYPESPRKGDTIDGLRRAQEMEGVLVFHAGTAAQEGRLVTKGGRVLNVVGTGASVREARDLAYAAADHIRFPGKQYRTDIAATTNGGP